jgi:hypothetical protein
MKRNRSLVYLAAFLIQCWLGGLVTRAAAGIRRKQEPQRGASFRVVNPGAVLVEMFELEPGKSCQVSSLVSVSLQRRGRFAGNSLRRALVPPSIEHRCLGGLFRAAKPSRVLEAKTVTSEGNAG